MFHKCLGRCFRTQAIRFYPQDFILHQKSNVCGQFRMHNGAQDIQDILGAANLTSSVINAVLI